MVEIFKGQRTGTFGYEYPVHVDGQLVTVFKNLTDARNFAANLSK